MNSRRILGHILCIITVIVWATTFVSTKVLLQGLSPIEILFIRFLLGCCALYIACPKKFPKVSLHQEFFIAMAGLSGVTIYYLFENIALSYTSASNVSIIVSAAPFFTALLAHLLGQEKRLTALFLIGFVSAMSGIVLITASDMSKLHLNPLGDLLAVLAALLWAVYCVLMKKINSYGISVLLITRKLFLYGLLFMFPMLFVMPISFNLSLLREPVFLGNLLYLGIGACAVCFVLWNYSLQILGPVTTSVYIYAQPVITILASALFIGEALTNPVLLGMLLTMTGLVISENRLSLRGLLHKIKAKKWRTTDDTI